MVNHPNRSKTLKFRRAINRQWLGNGMGHAPASYVIEYLGEVCGNLSYHMRDGWSVKFAPANWIGEFSTSRDRISDAKQTLIDEIARRNAAKSER